MRDELLNETLFLGLRHARTKIATWAAGYDTGRPHSALGYLTSAAQAALLTATGDRLRNPDQLRRSPVAPSAPNGVSPGQALIAGWMRVRGQVIASHDLVNRNAPIGSRESMKMTVGISLQAGSVRRIEHPSYVEGTTPTSSMLGCIIRKGKAA